MRTAIIIAYFLSFFIFWFRHRRFIYQRRSVYAAVLWISVAAFWLSSFNDIWGFLFMFGPWIFMMSTSMMYLLMELWNVPNPVYLVDEIPNGTSKLREAEEVIWKDGVLYRRVPTQLVDSSA
jgi:hypothetical protein